MSKFDEKGLEVFAKLIIEKISSISENWKQPWINTGARGVLPQNLDGRKYNGINTFGLYLLSEAKNYELPVFLTFNQAKEKDLHILKGEQSFPVIYWNFYARDKDSGKKIPMDDYNQLGKEEKENYKLSFFQNHYNVFNIAQTNVREDKKELWDDLEKRFHIEPLKNKDGMFENPKLDYMVDRQAWIVPICPTRQNQSYYSHVDDKIVLPLKAQFKNGESYYEILLHEMTHSTSTKERLNRETGSSFADRNYSREELVAELTAALVGQEIGISSSIREENAQYLKSWLNNIKESPEFLFSVLSDVNKASTMINSSLDHIVLEDKKTPQTEELSKDEIDKLYFIQTMGMLPKEQSLIEKCGFQPEKQELDGWYKELEKTTDPKSYIYDIEAKIRMKAGMILESSGNLPEGTTKKQLLEEGYTGKFINSVEDLQRVIQNTKVDLNDHIENASIVVDNYNADDLSFKLLAYDGDLNYVGTIKGEPVEYNKWKLSADTDKAVLAVPKDVAFLDTDVNGSLADVYGIHKTLPDRALLNEKEELSESRPEQPEEVKSAWRR